MYKMGSSDDTPSRRNLLAFFIFGVCNNFCFVVMLTSSEDILAKNNAEPRKVGNTSEQCINDLSEHKCGEISTGAVLICNIIPAVVVQFTFALFIHKVPYLWRIIVIAISQAAGLFLAALAQSVPVALTAVVLGSFSMGFGEMTFLALSSRYHKNTVSWWAAGTGAAGIVASSLYASCISLLHLTPRTTLLCMLFVPVLYFCSYAFILQKASPIRSVSKEIARHLSHSASVSDGMEKQIIEEEKELTKGRVVMKILPFLIVVCTTYFGSYYTSQGMAELVYFTCDKGMGLSTQEQFRWYQVIYQIGSFLAKVSGNVFILPIAMLYGLPIVLVILSLILLTSSLGLLVLPHVTLAMLSMGFVGFANGVSYVNTAKHVHKSTSEEYREFAMTVIAPCSMIGILVAALAAIPTHAAICEYQSIHF